MKFNKKFWATSFTLTGTIVGAGILGLPYVFSRSGFLVGTFWLIFLGVVMTYVTLCLGEINLRTKKDLHLPGLVRLYLGERAGTVMLLIMVFGVYSALIAYLIGVGNSLSFIFLGESSNSVYFALGFWFVMSLLLREGLKGLKKVETWGVLAIIFLVFLIAVIHFPNINYENLSSVNSGKIFLPFGVVLFALMGFSSLPELEQVIKGNEKNFKNAIIVGSIIPVILYLIFSFVFVGVLGESVPVIATLGFGKIVSFLGIFTMMTSYFVLSFAIKDVFKLDFKLPKSLGFVLTTILPIGVYLILYLINFLDFVSILGIGGVISGGLTGILIMLSAKKAKEQGKRKPEYSMLLNWWIIGIVSIIFLLGIFVQLFFN